MPTSINSKRRKTLHRWIALLQRHLPPLSLPQARGLALWSIGIVLAKSTSLHAVVLALACWLPFNPHSLRKRLQEWYLEADAKQGQQRRDFDPQQLCPFLLGWILQRWPNRQLVLALDPTNFSDRFIILNISVLYRGCAVPIIWTVLAANHKEPWEPHWERMLKTLAEHVPAGWQVLVLTDRGLYSPRLFACVKQWHFHPFLRIRAQGYYRPLHTQKWLELKDLQPPMDEVVSLKAEVFKNESGLEATLLAFHGQGYAEPWLIVTDLEPEVAQPSWYGLRGWIEQGYKRIKGEGWKLPRTRISDPQRLERLWLAVAVSTMWVLEVGGEADARAKSSGKVKRVGEDMPELPDLGLQAKESGAEEQGRSRASSGGKQVGKETGSSGRLWSVFSRGWQLLRNALAVGLLLLGSWHPEPWPHHPVEGLPPTPGVVAGCQAREPPAMTDPNRLNHHQNSC
jgi:hypothetical protein